MKINCVRKFVLALLIFAVSLPAIASDIADAVMKGDISRIITLLKAGANPNSKSPNGYTLLYGASILGHTEIVRVLLKHGAKVDEMAFEIAVVNGRTEIVEELLRAGANANYRNPKDGYSVLMNAASTGNTGVVGILLKYGADPKVKDASGRTALDFAKRNRDELDKTVKLLENKAP